MINPSHLALVSLLTQRVRELICARSLAERGRQRDVAHELGKAEWQVRDTIRAAARYSPAQLTACLSACATCERELKSGSDEETAFLRLISMFCVAPDSTQSNSSW